MTRRLWLAGVLAALVAAVAACDGQTPEEAVGVPCGGEASTVLELGAAQMISERTAQFSTTGGAVWVTARGVDQGGFFDTDVTRIDLGPAETPPSHDRQTGVVENRQAELRVKEDFWGPLELEEGTYWVWSSNGGEVEVQTCEGSAIFDPVPAS